jgi:hypothetical protein
MKRAHGAPNHAAKLPKQRDFLAERRESLAPAQTQHNKQTKKTKTKKKRRFLIRTIDDRGRRANEPYHSSAR